MEPKPEKKKKKKGISDLHVASWIDKLIDKNKMMFNDAKISMLCYKRQNEEGRVKTAPCYPD